MIDIVSLICITLLPLLINTLCSRASHCISSLLTNIWCIGHETREISHTIALSSKSGMRAQPIDEARNDIFIKCILMYLAKTNHYFKHSNTSLITTDPRLNSTWRDQLQIQSFCIANKPLPKKRLKITNNIWLIYDQRVHEKSDHSLVTTSYLFTSPNAANIDDFVEEAYHDYLHLLTQQKDTRRYFFSLFINNNEPMFKKYTLDSNNTFDTLFFPEKKSLLTFVDSFQEKTGKFAVKGTPQKLGFLLSGLPGTGKTSIIKALASYTNRHIVNISLSKIKTNQMLHDIMFDCKFNVGEELPLPIQLKDVIFIFEDIDVSSDVCHARELQSLDEELEEVQIDNTTVKRPVLDRLNLSGLLNALDGVVDSPNRIIVLTTNNASILDDALVRPGRIDFKLNMHHMQPTCINQMLRHYFPNKEVDQNNDYSQMTPAVVQQIICQNDYEDALKLLHK